MKLSQVGVRDQSALVVRRLRRALRGIGEFILICCNENISVKLKDVLEDVRSEHGTDDEGGDSRDEADGEAEDRWRGSSNTKWMSHELGSIF